MDRSFLRGRRVAVGVGGGIAAFKACEFVRELRRSGALTRVAMTPAAQQFVTPLTLQSLSGQPVLTDYFDLAQEKGFGHLDLARWAEVYVVLPATADLLARIRAGMANDAVVTSLLAFRGPVLLAPAMNTAMWENEVTQENVRALLARPRFRMVGPEAGELADGDVGMGRLAGLEALIDAVAQLGSAGPLSGRRVLVTAGPTREYLDPVRFLSNPSTGKMGLALAQAARALGAAVTVVLGPSEAQDRDGLEIISVVSAEEMAQAVLSRVAAADYLIAAAAVSDYRPQSKEAQKRKKSQGPLNVPMERTPDVLAEASALVAQSSRRPFLVGFAAETERVVEHAQEKLVRKDLDLVVANDVGSPGAGFAVDTNEVTVVGRNGVLRELRGAKQDVANEIWKLILGEQRAT